MSIISLILLIVLIILIVEKKVSKRNTIINSSLILSPNTVRMQGSNGNNHLNKVTFATLLVTMGIIYGDIGTSPLYVMKAIVGQMPISRELVLGGISCVFWTLTIQTTVKYVLLTLKADNKGEGGIFSLYSLIKDRKKKWLIIPAIIGGSTLIADGMITPPISVSSAIEGIEAVIPNIQTVPIVIAIISFLFFFQRFGTQTVGKFFGPVMFTWFFMLGTLGIRYIVKHPDVLLALSPTYAINLLIHYPSGFALLGAVFLCTTGAEALYSDLGHCGIKNIRISWIFVKITLVLNYLGQGAYLLENIGNKVTTNPFYGIMPSWFLIPGIIIATLAAIIASQALISGTFTLIGEAIRLNLYPKVQVKYPSDVKGQLFINNANNFLWLGCIFVVLYFKRSENMEAAYGLSITITMLMTTLLLSFYLKKIKVNPLLIILFLAVYLVVEIGFFAANLLKFMHGGYVTIFLASIMILLMAVWYYAHLIKRGLVKTIKIDKFKQQLIDLSNDEGVPKYATNLVYLSGAERDNEAEFRIFYSILQKQPKRADIYWFVHIHVTDEPYTMEYKVIELAKDDIIKVSFRLGFRVQQRINVYLRNVINDLVKNNELNIITKYNALLREPNLLGDFKYIILEEVLSSDNALPFWEQLVMDLYINIKNFTAAPEKWFGLDTSLVDIEKVPLLIKPVREVRLKRLFEDTKDPQ